MIQFVKDNAIDEKGQRTSRFDSLSCSSLISNLKWFIYEQNNFLDIINNLEIYSL